MENKKNRKNRKNIASWVFCNVVGADNSWILVQINLGDQDELDEQDEITLS